jgi:hypothetical protein
MVAPDARYLELAVKYTYALWRRLYDKAKADIPCGVRCMGVAWSETF